MEFFFELNLEVYILQMIFTLSGLISCRIGLLCLFADQESDEVHFDFWWFLPEVIEDVFLCFF